MEELPHLSSVRKAPPTSVTVCSCWSRSRLELWGECTGSFAAGCCGTRTVLVKPAGTRAPRVEGRAQIIRCSCSWTRVTIERGPVLGTLRCGHCGEAIEFAAMTVRPPRVALVDAPGGGAA